MNLYHTLDLWAQACTKTQIQWSLYKDTLLCAEGYHSFPDELDHPQVAIFAEDLLRTVDQVFSNLPADWRLDKEALLSKNPQICFLQNGRVVLSVHPLMGAKDRDAFLRLVNPVVVFWKKKISQNKIQRMILELFGRFIKKSLREKIDEALAEKYRNAAEQVFAKMLDLSSKSKKGLPLYFELICPKWDDGMCSALFGGQEMISLSCEDGTERRYPAYSGYRRLLENSYGDYQRGLFDDIGCGLSAADKEELREHQAHCREALAYVQRISCKHNLRYYLLAGSVLGAVRHEGFIPWDDDVDIGIRIEEVDAFEEAILRELPEGFTLERSAPNHPYPRMFSKICYQGRCCIDFWPLVPTHVDGFKAVYTWYFGKIITKAHYQKIGYKVNAFLKIVKVMDLILNDRQVMWLARRNERRYAGKQTPAYINLYSIYTRQKETILRQWLDTEATAMFEGIEVPIVGCTDAYLTHLYGDYMAFPPRWKRASRHVERF